MRRIRVLSRFLALLILLASAGSANAVEIIKIRTGQVGGVPGICPFFDDRFTVYVQPGCNAPFANPFITADFITAQFGPQAWVQTPVPSYLPSLPSDSLARWIHSDIDGACIGAPAHSVLYACKFRVNSCDPLANVSICWAVDDKLGDPAGTGPNPIGVYINGVPLSSAFSGGSLNTETCALQNNVPLLTGDNWLYVYQRDTHCAQSGLILTATLTVTGSCPSLTASKFNDWNWNGIQDGLEPGISGWPIQLTGPVSQSDTTDSNGQVLFACLPVGNYQVTEVTDYNWVETAPTGGVVNVAVDCGMDYVAVFGNHFPDWDHCVTLDKCLTAWFPFDEGAGTLANEVAANRDGTIVGGPTWAGFGGAASPSYLKFPGGAGTQKVTVPDYPEHDFGTGSFTIAAWVRTSNADGLPHAIVDKRVGPFLTPTGYVLYLRNGVLSLQYGDGSGAPTTHTSSAPPCNDDEWHIVVASVCRNRANPSTNVARLKVDNHVTTFTTGIPTGSLSNSAGLVIGDQCPGFIQGIPFDGGIDEVQLYACCPADLPGNTPWPYCKDACYVPSILNSSGPIGFTTLTICNYSLTPQTYAWSVAGSGIGAGCDASPTMFSPFSGTVTVPGANNGPACVNIPIQVVMPSAMANGQVACYSVTFINTSCGCAYSCGGKIRKTSPFSTHAVPTEVELPMGAIVPVAFMVRNHGDTPMVFDYGVLDPGLEDDPDDVSIKLNGLPPGEPVTGTLLVAPRDSAMISVSAEIAEFQPLRRHEIILQADMDGDGVPEPLDCMSFVSLPEGAMTEVPQAPAGGVPRILSQLMVAVPNPFRDETAVEFTLGSARPGVRVEIFDVTGRLVRSLHSGPLSAGSQRFVWDGQDERGSRSSAGIYFIRAQAGAVSLMTKVLRLE